MATSPGLAYKGGLTARDRPAATITETESDAMLHRSRATLLNAMIAAAMIAGLMFAPTGVAAQTSGSELFLVEGVAVDATGDTTEIARNLAFTQGERQALATLLERLGVSAGQIDPQSLSEAELAGLVQSFQVVSERTSPGHYVGQLTYQFRPEAVRSMLQSNGIGFADTVSRPVVVVPVYRDGADVRLWEGTNAWHQAWLEAPMAQGTVPMVVPYGDLQDVAAINQGQALAGDLAPLQEIAEVHQAGGTMVVLAEPQPQALSVTVSAQAVDWLPGRTVLTVDGDPTDPLVLQRAVAETIARVEGHWQSATLTHSGVGTPSGAGLPATGPQPDGSATGSAVPASPAAQGGSELVVVVPIVRREDWFLIQQRIAQVPTVATARVVSLTIREATLRLSYSGTQEQLRLALAQYGLSLQSGPMGPELRLN